MGKYFGTDGIREVANVALTAELAFKIGRAAAYVLTSETKHRAKILIGKDTRISSDMLEAALVAGICASGADVELLGVIPTPAVAYLTIQHKADAGIVISASHNSYEYNGIKIFAASGYKLSDDLEARVEECIDKSDSLPMATHKEIGKILKSAKSPIDEYVDMLCDTLDGDLNGLRVAVDCANGSASTTAAQLFRRLNCESEIRFYEPDGVNINENCGSTHLNHLASRVKNGSFDVGIAFDGDADRCLVVDDQGEIFDGDRIMAFIAADMKKKGKLRGNAFVATVMSNLGLHAYAKEAGIGIECANVGDRFVLERMLEGGYVLGGEQSGHVIFMEYATTGDGQLTAIQFLNILKHSGLKLSTIAEMIKPYPQVLINVAVPSSEKHTIAAKPEVAAAIVKAEAALGTGRILVRPSGTEALVRVMVEGKDAQLVQNAAESVVKVIEAVVE